MEVETTSIEINIMNYSTRLADYEIYECAKCKHICFNFKKKNFKLYQKVKLMQYKKQKQKIYDYIQQNIQTTPGNKIFSLDNRTKAISAFFLKFYL